jgi:hypothetical protein
MPGSLGEMADRIDDHQRALPARLELAQSAVLMAPMLQFALQPRQDLTPEYARSSAPSAPLARRASRHAPQHSFVETRYNSTDPSLQLDQRGGMPAR